MTEGRPRRPKPTKKTLKALSLAIKFFGGQTSDLASAIKVSRQLVTDWRAGNSAVSFRCAILIENKTDGAVEAIDLIPEIQR